MSQEFKFVIIYSFFIVISYFRFFNPIYVNPFPSKGCQPRWETNLYTLEFFSKYNSYFLVNCVFLWCCFFFIKFWFILLFRFILRPCYNCKLDRANILIYLSDLKVGWTLFLMYIMSKAWAYVHGHAMILVYLLKEVDDVIATIETWTMVIVGLCYIFICTNGRLD